MDRCAPRVECLAIGSEMLSTHRLDTNSLWIADRLAELGLTLRRKTVLSDDPEELKQAFSEALSRADLLIVTGGLGPTFDDLSKECLAECCGVPLVFHKESWERIHAFFEARHRMPNELQRKQAMVPQGADILPNTVGTAPGIDLRVDWKGKSRRIILLPGVPREMEQIWRDSVHSSLAAMDSELHLLRLVIGGVPESILDERTRPLREAFSDLEWTILSNLHQRELLLRSRDRSRLLEGFSALQTLLGPDLARVGEGDVEHAVLEQLAARKETLAMAESVTGGWITSRLTVLPGCSRVLKGSAVVYGAEAKVQLGGLNEAFLAKHGTVSERSTRELAEKLREKLQVTWGLAVTGNAGPESDPGALGADQKVGQCYLALAGPGETEVWPWYLAGVDRAELCSRLAAEALDRLRRKTWTGGFEV